MRLNVCMFTAITWKTGLWEQAVRYEAHVIKKGLVYQHECVALHNA